MTAEQNEFLDSLEKAGLDEVRARLDRGAYGNAGKRRSKAEGWVAQKERDAEAVVRAEQNEIASRAADGTVRQASAVEVAKRIAIATLLVSAIAAVLTIIAMARHG
jgi:hypothetical protein